MKKSRPTDSQIMSILKPSRRKQMTQEAVSSRNVSVRFACRLFVVGVTGIWPVFSISA